MFGFFSSEQSRARHDAKNWLHLANKVFHFRQDQLPEQEIKQLETATRELKSRLRERADAARLKLAMEQLEGCLRKSGGTYYPKSSMADNVEFFLVALILFLGIRAFIASPFKIPTNSMFPSYNGMTAEVFDTPGEEPGLIARTARLLVFGASPRRVVAPADGDLKIAFALTERGGIQLSRRDVKTRKWIFLPAPGHEYAFYVGGKRVTVTVPSEFRFEKLILNEFFPEGVEAVDRGIKDALKNASQNEHWVEVVTNDGRRGTIRELAVDTGKKVRAGENAFAFDIMTGDQLFVDRISYNFVRPKVGDGLVFRTINIPYIEPPAKVTDKFYIKRLVGVPGDTLEVREPVLYRNGEPIEGSKAFGKNARRDGDYPGYVNTGRLDVGQTATVPEHSFFAMGDNSPDSSDGRVWGFVPERDVVGRPLFIYYPFTRRWGPAP